MDFLNVVVGSPGSEFVNGLEKIKWAARSGRKDQRNQANPIHRPLACVNAHR
jgi:hypothetical protein